MTPYLDNERLYMLLSRMEDKRRRFEARRRYNARRKAHKLDLFYYRLLHAGWTDAELIAALGR